ncbi:hypothetical protein [Lutimonas sp.]|uniref:hypothetical protein n=1 Tax=Lutimonas sp. TaxID=1872403 RepID=UPI003D9B2483
MALKKYLLINSCFSFFCGACMLIFNIELSDFFHITQPLIFTIIGINLLFFAGFVLFTALSKRFKKILVNSIVSLDAAWVAGSLYILLSGAFNLSFNGYLTIAVVALFIAFLAYKQHSTLKDLISIVDDKPGIVT